MTKTVTSLFHDQRTANATVSRLEQAGISRGDVTVYADASGDLADDLSGLGVPASDAHAYAEGVRRGGTLVAVSCDDDEVDQVVAILDRDEGILDLDERQSAWRSEGWQGHDASTSGTPGGLGAAAAGLGAALTGNPANTGGRDASTMRTGMTGTDATGTGRLGTGAAGLGGPLTGTPGSSRSSGLEGDLTGSPDVTRTRDEVGATATRMRDTGDEVIPIAEEELHVGKQEVNRGRVRIHSHVVERPVQEQVTLRDETVAVERRPVSGRETTLGGDPFQERTVEVEEHDEQAVVSKEARVKEELVLRKDVEQRTETVSDTVRRTEVDVEDERGVRGTGTGGSPDRNR